MGLLESAPTTEGAQLISFTQHGISELGLVVLVLAVIGVGPLIWTMATPNLLNA